MKFAIEQGELWCVVKRMARRILSDSYPHPYLQAKQVVKHDRILNGERIFRERRP